MDPADHRKNTQELCSEGQPRCCAASSIPQARRWHWRSRIFKKKKNTPNYLWKPKLLLTRTAVSGTLAWLLRLPFAHNTLHSAVQDALMSECSKQQQPSLLTIHHCSTAIYPNSNMVSKILAKHKQGKKMSPNYSCGGGGWTDKQLFKAGLWCCICQGQDAWALTLNVAQQMAKES